MTKPPHGGKRPGSGRKPAANPATVHAVRCTKAGWDWLKAQAAKGGFSSVGKWADGMSGDRTKTK